MEKPEPLMSDRCPVRPGCTSPATCNRTNVCEQTRVVPGREINIPDNLRGSQMSGIR